MVSAESNLYITRAWKNGTYCFSLQSTSSKVDKPALSRVRQQRPVTLYCTLFFTPSSHLVQGLPLSLLTSTSDLYTLPGNCSPLIRSTCLEHFKTFRSITHLTQTKFTPHFSHLPILVTPYIRRYQLISLISSFCLSSILYSSFLIHMSPLVLALFHATPSSVFTPKHTILN